MNFSIGRIKVKKVQGKKKLFFVASLKEEECKSNKKGDGLRHIILWKNLSA